MRLKLFRILCLLTLLICFSHIVNAQSNKTSKKDTTKLIAKGFVARMQDFAKQSAITSAADLQEDRAEQIQEATIVEIKKHLQKAKLYLRTGLDTLTAKNELSLIAAHVTLVSDGLFSHKDHTQTYRNLVTTEKILKVLLNKCTLQKNKLDSYKKQLSVFKYQMDSLANVRELLAFPEDSVKLSKYMQALSALSKEVAPIDSVLDQSILQTQALQTQANLQAYSLENNLDEIALYQREMSKHFFKKEFAFIWMSTEHMAPFSHIINYSIEKAKLNLQFYSSSNLGIVLTILVLLGVCYAFIFSLKKTYNKEIEEKEIKEEHLILKYPLISAFFMITNLAQFLFSAPPFIFSLIFWLVAAAALTILMRGYISKFWMFAWLAMLSLFVLSSLDNLILQASGVERWYMFLLSTAGIAVGTVIFKKDKRDELREKLILYAIGLMILLEISSLVFNVFGSYNLSKALLVAGYVNVIIAIMFLWTVRLINQGLQLAFDLYASQDKSLFFMNFDRVGQRAPALLYLLLAIGWIILFGRNFPAYAFLVEPVRDFFFDQRAIGSYTFSISNLILFFFVVTTAVIVSKVVSFFALDKRTFSKQQEGKRGIGSWVLLIRITIIILGLFLAFAAVGIPIDKIAIVLGALGVGIGFGLQSLVNNLVSGLVIAFEKPVNLDDEVEVAGKSGIVKSIGFRSSVITTFEGAEIVMPNGDLLNSHLVNWSSGNGRRRSSIVINIMHNANLQLIKEGILKVLNTDERILKHPEPNVYFQDITAEALELHVLYWTKQPKPVLEIKNDVIMAINQLFIENDIKVPYPKQEVFIHSDTNDKRRGEKNK
ncbi:mechanosensitive ion channel family protein [Pedobacter xixiisoli]|uniref:Small-conductance mechanosensitive channel n=1 Tax=Pedobacter xixiisoli TaxID=1476464 RepID=A0A285ZUQ7_9SPHI|nr:mechanosensitive ion channel domain-containing protein [Pedobacter xixiisoli]SOD13380.1 Small-conductance mechanosensitive channel [Pedobacter xixiisoli]